MKIILIILVLCISFVSSGQTAQHIREGNELYKQLQFDKAASAYKKAMEAEPGNDVAQFNLGNTLYKQNKPDEAVQVFNELAAHAKKTELKEQAYYNKGAIFSQQKKTEESIEAYKSALRLNPNDREARENLQKALLELKKKNKPKKKEEQDKKEQEEKQTQSRISPKEAQQRLQLLAQKEKEVQQRIQKERSKPGGSQTKDW